MSGQRILRGIHTACSCVCGASVCEMIVEICTCDLKPAADDAKPGPVTHDTAIPAEDGFCVKCLRKDAVQKPLFFPSAHNLHIDMPQLIAPYLLTAPTCQHSPVRNQAAVCLLAVSVRMHRYLRHHENLSGWDQHTVIY